MWLGGPGAVLGEMQLEREVVAGRLAQAQAVGVGACTWAACGTGGHRAPTRTC